MLEFRAQLELRAAPGSCHVRRKRQLGFPKSPISDFLYALSCLCYMVWCSSEQEGEMQVKLNQSEEINPAQDIGKRGTLLSFLIRLTSVLLFSGASVCQVSSGFWQLQSHPRIRNRILLPGKTVTIACKSQWKFVSKMLQCSEPFQCMH